VNQYLTSQGTGMADCADFREDCAYNRTGWSEEQLSLVRKRVSSRARERHVMSAVPRLTPIFPFRLAFRFTMKHDARKHFGSGPESLSLTDVWKFGNRLD